MDPPEAGPNGANEMSDGISFWWKILIAVVAAYLGYHLLIYMVHTILGLLIPLALIAGIGYVAYILVSRKAIGGGRRILP